jgi:putative ABC transport system ATP-binding protein
MADGELTRIRRDKIGFVFQKFNLLPTLTARGNIDVSRQIKRTRDAQDENLLQILRLLMIDDKMDRKPSELSGGEQQRVAIARAVSGKPAILLADEPTGSLDSKNSEIVLNMFRELNRKFRQTIILVTHNPELVTFTDRLIEMRDGVIVSDNDPSWDTDSELAQPARSV